MEKAGRIKFIILKPSDDVKENARDDNGLESKLNTRKLIGRID